MPTILLTVAYDGTGYSGWQTQVNGLAVQQVVENALEQLLGERVKLCSSGRTDAGVHARAMPASFSTNRELPLRAYIHGTNRFLPDDVSIQSACHVTDGFKPINEALAKHYRYTILNGTIRSPLDRLYSWLVREPLDLPAMVEAANFLVGRHDFAAFRASNCEAKTTVRRIDSVEVTRNGDFVTIDVIGEGFLKYMVRIISGTLVEVGRGRFAPQQLERLLLEGDRKKAGVTAPACGLCLIRVYFPDSGSERNETIFQPADV